MTSFFFSTSAASFFVSFETCMYTLQGDRQKEEEEGRGGEGRRRRRRRRRKRRRSVGDTLFAGGKGGGR